MDKFINYDHAYHDIGRLGDITESPLVGGDSDTWGDSAEKIGELHVFSPTLGQDGNTFLVCNGKSLDVNDWDVEFDTLAKFLESNLATKLSGEEIDFIVYKISGSYCGEISGETSGFDGDEWPLDDLKEMVGESLKGRIIIHTNVRYDCASEVSDNGEVTWMDDIDPDDDAQRVTVFKQE